MNGTRPRALLIQPPIYDFALYDLFHQPFGLMRIATWLQQSGYDVELLDCLDIQDPARPKRAAVRRSDGTGKFLRQVVDTPLPLKSVRRRYARYGISESSIAARILDARPDLALIGTGMTYWYEGCQEVARAVRGFSAQLPLVAGGVYATLLRDHCAERLQTDSVVAGSADPALRTILSGLGMPVPDVPLPYQPDPGLRAASIRLQQAAVIRLNDGCPFSCDYCASPLLQPGFASGDAAALLQAIHETAARWGILNFAFYDDALLHSARTSFVPFLEQVIQRFGRRKIRFYVPNAVHARRITVEMARLMYDAGFREVRLGIESDDPEFHRVHGQKVDVDTLSGCVAALKNAGFHGCQITGYLLAGVPGTSVDEFARSLTTVESLGIRISIAEYSPVPGTPLFDAACKQSRLPLREEPLCHNNSILPTVSEVRGRVVHHNRTLGYATM